MPESIPPPAEAPRHVFVYGTLRRGEANDINRLHPAPRFVGTAQLRGTLYHLGQYPGLRLIGDTLVQGEVYAISAPLEAVLDEIEAVYPQQSDEYSKAVVHVEVDGQALECLIYLINPAYVTGKPLLQGGDWVRER